MVATIVDYDLGYQLRYFTSEGRDGPYTAGLVPERTSISHQWCRGRWPQSGRPSSSQSSPRPYELLQLAKEKNVNPLVPLSIPPKLSIQLAASAAARYRGYFRSVRLNLANVNNTK